MNIKIKENYDGSRGVYYNVLRERGLCEKEVKALMNGGVENQLSYKLLSDIENGANMFIDNINSNIGIIVDCDNDGYTSAMQLVDYIKKIKKEGSVDLYFHKGKKHGLSSDIIIETQIQFLIIPDAGTNDTKQLKELVRRGIKVLVLDHHELEDTFEYIEGVVIVNPQLSNKYYNKDISGAGVVYKFLQCVDDKTNNRLADKNLDVVAFGNLGDHMANTLETRGLMNWILNEDNVTNLFIKTMISNALKYSPYTLQTIAFKCVPLINAICRFGDMGDKEMLMKAFLSSDQEFVDEAIKKCTSIKGKQDRARNKAFKAIQDVVEKSGLLKYPVMVIDVSDLYSGNELTGVVANKVSEVYNRPIILIGGRGSGEEGFRGSARNNNIGVCDDFKEWCLNSGLFDLASGHQNSFGVVLKSDNINLVMEKSLEDFKDVELTGSNYVVDASVPIHKVTKKDLKDLALIEGLWCTNLKEPLIHINNIFINSNNINKLGSRGNVLSFEANDMKFIKFFLSGEFYDKITLKDECKFGSIDVEMEVVVKCKVNEYNGKKNLQLEIVDAESKKATTARDIVYGDNKEDISHIF